MSTQHLVIYIDIYTHGYRFVPSKDTRDASGNLLKVIKPYIMDLGSSHKTFLNKEQLEEARYYELREKDTLTFGASSREYVLLHDSSAGVEKTDTKKSLLKS